MKQGLFSKYLSKAGAVVGLIIDHALAWVWGWLVAIFEVAFNRQVEPAGEKAAITNGVQAIMAANAMLVTIAAALVLYAQTRPVTPRVLVAYCLLSLFPLSLNFMMPRLYWVFDDKIAKTRRRRQSMDSGAVMFAKFSVFVGLILVSGLVIAANYSAIPGQMRTVTLRPIHVLENVFTTGSEPQHIKAGDRCITFTVILTPDAFGGVLPSPLAIDLLFFDDGPTLTSANGYAGLGVRGQHIDAHVFATDGSSRARIIISPPDTNEIYSIECVAACKDDDQRRSLIDTLRKEPNSGLLIMGYFGSHAQ